MAKVIIRISCGCGFNTVNLEEAASHADSAGEGKGHQLEIRGSLSPTSPVSRPKRLPIRDIIGWTKDDEEPAYGERQPHGN